MVEEQPKKETALTPEIVNLDEQIKIKDLTVKELTEIIQKQAVQAVINLEKKDYRAQVLLREERAQVPDALTAFIDLKQEEAENTFGFNRDLDIMGTISPFDWWKNKDTRFIVAHAELKDWEYIEREVKDSKTGEMVIEQIPLDLAQLDSEEGRWLALSVFGNQSEKEIRMMRAGTGLPQEESNLRKAAGWFGFVRRKKSDVYPQQPEQQR